MFTKPHNLALQTDRNARSRRINDCQQQIAFLVLSIPAGVPAAELGRCAAQFENSLFK